jgi:hypothetical protein
LECKYPDDPPPIPLRGTTHASLSDLQHWRKEIKTSIAEKKSATAALSAADEAIRAAIAHKDAVVERVKEADSRGIFAYDSYIKLYGLASSNRENSSDVQPSPGPAALVQGKGRARDDGDMVESEGDGDSGDVPSGRQEGDSMDAS